MRPAATTSPCARCATPSPATSRACSPFPATPSTRVPRRVRHAPEAIAYVPAYAPALRPAVALHPLRRLTRARRGRRSAPPPPASSCWRCQTTTPSAASPRPRPPGASTACAWSPPSRSPPSTRARRARANCTSSATPSTTPAPQLTERLAHFLGDRERRTLRMAAALREQGLELDEAQLDARVAAGQPIGRPHLAEAALASPANATRLARGEHRRGRLVHPRLPDRGPPRLPPARDAHHRRGRAGHPRRRRRGRVGAPLLGPLRGRERCSRASTASARSASTAWRPSTSPTRASRPSCWPRAARQLGLLSTGSADFHGPENRLFSRFLAFETYGLEPNLGPIASAGKSACNR